MSDKQSSFESADASHALECRVLDGFEQADCSWLETEGGLEQTVRELISAPPRNNRRLHLGSSTLLSLVRSGGADGEPIGVHMLVNAERLLVVCYGTEALVRDALARHVEHREPNTVSRLLPVIVTALVKPLESEISRIADVIDDLEDKAMAEDEEKLDDAVVLVGRQLLEYRRYLLPMRDELGYLALNPEELPDLAEPRYLRRAAENLGRLIGALDSSHQRVTLILNQLRNRDEARLTHAMHKLTIVATVFLPLTFITGLLGINVAGIPESHNPLAFWLVCIFLLGVGIFAVVLLRWRNWM